jgi:hypothetical protein
MEVGKLMKLNFDKATIKDLNFRFDELSCYKQQGMPIRSITPLFLYLSLQRTGSFLLRC